MFQRFIALARNAFLETIRQPIFGVILFVTALLMVFNVSLAAFTLDDDDDFANDFVAFRSGDDADVASRPQLVVTYQ